MRLKNDDVKLEVIRDYAETSNYSEVGRRHGLNESTVRRFLNKETFVDWWENYSPNVSGTKSNHHDKIEVLDRRKKYVFTSAQNNTFVNKQFLKSLELYCDHNNAELIVGTFSYNVKGFQNLSKGEAEWFDPLIEKYIVDEPRKIFDGLLWLGELNILPTAVSPLNTLKNYTKLDSAIVPHAKLQLESVPTHFEDDTKILYTTGAVTLQNYIAKFSGQKASFHHVFSALVVENNGVDWFVRQLVCDADNGFYDLDTYYCGVNGVQPNASVLAINYGDIHAEKEDPRVFDACFRSSDSMLDVLKPEYQFAHDILDFEARNHHTINDCYMRFLFSQQKLDSVEDNIRKVGTTLKEMERSFSNIIVVESNHDLALERWLKTADYKQDPENAILFLTLQLEKYKSIAENRDISMLETALNHVLPEGYIDSPKFLRVDESFKLVDGYGGIIECGCHGHLGNNGARPSSNSFVQLGTRYNIGHSHSARIFEGVYQAGVSARMKMGYNKGGSSWSWSHIVTYPNGKRCIITMKKHPQSKKACWRA